MPGLYSHTTRGTGTVLTATIYNTDHQNHIDNQVPQQMDDYSSGAAQMQSATDPGEAGSESLPTTLAGELERLRFALNEVKTYLGLTSAQWYTTATGTVAVAKGGTGAATAGSARTNLGSTATGDALFTSASAAAARTTLDVYSKGETDALQGLFTTGDAKLTFKITPDTGWVMADDGSIGSAASGATNRANADTEALYTLLWNNVADAEAPVSSGRGANAAADFAANKTLTLTKTLGRAISVAGAGAGLTSRVLGLAMGTETHTLTTAQTPVKSHGHGGVVVSGNTDNFQLNAGGSPAVISLNGGSTSATSDATASAHSIMGPSTFMNVMVKL